MHPVHRQLINPTDAGLKLLLEKFVLQLSTGDFDQAPLSKWRDQFRKFEQMHGFAAKFATLTAGKGARRARLLTRRGRTPRSLTS